LVIGESTTFRSREQCSVPSSQLRTGRFASLRISFQREQRREPPVGTMLIFRGKGVLRLRSAAPRFAQDDRERSPVLSSQFSVPSSQFPVLSSQFSVPSSPFPVPPFPVPPFPVPPFPVPPFAVSQFFSVLAASSAIRSRGSVPVLGLQLKEAYSVFGIAGRGVKT
jgi:hypothetical protein